MLVGMFEVLVAKHEPMAMIYQMLQSLQGMFGQPSEWLRHEATISAMTARMKEGTLVQEYVLRMMTYLNTIETHGACINEHS